MRPKALREPTWQEREQAHQRGEHFPRHDPKCPLCHHVTVAVEHAKDDHILRWLRWWR